MPPLARLGLELKRNVGATLNGCAQLAFCDSPRAGVLVLGGLALASPFAGIGALLGAAFGAIVGRYVPAYSGEEWSRGLASLNPAIVGLFFSGFLASGERHPALLVPLLAASLLLDAGYRRALARIALPALSAAAVTTLYAVSAFAAPPGGWFWTDAATNALMPLGALGGACVVAAMIVKSRFAGVYAVALSAIAACACWLAAHDPRAVFGLWAITVPLASFGMHAVFLRGSLAGCVAGTLAALLGALAWVAWEASPLAQWLPPLLVPFILGTWLAMVLMRRAMASPVAGAAFWRAARALLAARAADREVVLLLAAGATRDPGSSTPFDGGWRELPRFAFEREALRASPRCRREFWETCARLRERPARASGLARRVVRLQRRGWIQTTIVGDAGPVWNALPDGALRLRGDVRITRCMDCGTEGPWPPQRAWRHCDLRCAACQGPVIPAVTLPGASADEAVAAALRDLATRCAMCLVLGDLAGEPETHRFLERVRRAGAAVIFVSEIPESDHPPRDDICVRMPAERFLACVAPVLAGGNAMTGLGIAGSARRSVRNVGGQRGGEAVR